MMFPVGPDLVLPHRGALPMLPGRHGPPTKLNPQAVPPQAAPP